MKNLLIYTTVNDRSVPFFLFKGVLEIINITFCFLEEDFSKLEETINSKTFDYIYIRDPFPSKLSKNTIEERVSKIINLDTNAYYIDSIENLEDIFFEDKFRQYKIYSDFMPPTQLLSDVQNVPFNNYIIKKRISSRSTGILFDIKDIQDSQEKQNYILQEKLHIEKEYRVYVIFNRIIPTVSVKSTKTQSVKTKVIGAEEIGEELENFVKMLLEKNKFDFLGLDIAQVKNKYTLLEINRSCLFGAFYKHTGINLAEAFISGLLSR